MSTEGNPNPEGQGANEQVVDIPVGHQAEGWREIVRGQGYDPAKGYTTLEGDGLYHWHLYPDPRDPAKEGAFLNEVETWEAA